MHLVLRHQTEERLIFTLHRFFRLFFYAVAVLMVAFWMADPQASRVAPIFLMVVCLLCGSYYEAWVFDSARQTIEHHHGIFFLFKRTKIPMQDLQSVQLNRFRKGHPGKASPPIEDASQSFFQPEMQKLSLLTKNGVAHDIEILKGSHEKSLEKKAQAIATFCQIPLVHQEAGLFP